MLRISLILAMIVAVLASIGLFVGNYFTPLSDALWRLRFLSPLFALQGGLHRILGSAVSGVDFTPLLIAALAVILRQVLDRILIAIPLGAKRQLPAPASARAAGRSQAPQLSVEIPHGTSALSRVAKKEKEHLELLRKIAATKKRIETATGKEREEAIAEIADAQATLEAQKKPLSFLALDVVGSTKMKASQHKLLIEHAFMAFRVWADAILVKHNVWKSSWTPDGVMAAFHDINAAADAARDILRDLSTFNKQEHEMDVPFQIRLGVSHGEVLFPDEARVDEVTDQVIDLAGHLQKHADSNTLLMAKRDFDNLRDKKGFRSVSQQVDGHTVLEWTA